MTDAAKVSPPAAWRVWANPIFRRYCRSRLRARGLLPSLIVTLVLASFAYIITPMVIERTSEVRIQYHHYMEEQAQKGREGKKNFDRYMETQQNFGLDPARLHEPHIYQRAALIPLLLLQALILFVIGTGQVAGGMTGERDEGMVDYQRLTPITPLAKVLGYLMGLPVREWVLFLSTLPFTALALWRGQVPFDAWWPVALIFFTSVMLYHLTGLTTGTVMKSRRWAFLLCMALIFVIYFLVPQSSRYGLPFMRYVTMWPVVMDSAHIFPEEQIRAWRFFASIPRDSSGVDFFKWRFSDIAFTLLVQGSFILTLLVMVWRKWRVADSHLLSKAWAILVFAWLAVLQLGNALPGIEDGSLFPTSIRQLLQNEPGQPQLEDVLRMSALYGVLLLLLLMAFIVMLTPSHDTQSRGLRRAAKLGRVRAPFFADESSAFHVVLLLTAAGAGAWAWFTRTVLGSHWFQNDPGVGTFFIFFAVLAPAALGLHAMMESRGGKWPFLAVIFLGVVPILASAIVLASSRNTTAEATTVAGASPIALTAYAVEQVIPFRNTRYLQSPFHIAAGPALIGWSALYSTAAVVLMVSLRRHWKGKK